MAFLKHVLVAGVVATLATFADAHSALLANGKLLGQLNSGECFNCAVGQHPVPSTIPASAVDASDPEDGIAAYLKTSGGTVKDTWNAFRATQSYGSITEPEAIKSDTCGRYSPTAVGEIPAGAKISYKKSNHNGPAEIWVDDKKVWAADNFIRDGGSLTADVFKCSKASCKVTWYWIGKVKVKGKWDYYQLYVQCFNVKGSGSGNASAGDDETPAATSAPKTTKPSGSDADETPAATTKAPKATKTPKPAASDADETPAATTKAPKTSKPAGSADDDATPGTVTPPSTGNDDDAGSDSKAARQAAKEKRKAEKAAAKAARQAAKHNGTNTDDDY